MTINKMKKFLGLLGTTTLVASPIIAMSERGVLNNNLNLNKEVKNYKTNEPVSATYTYNFDNWIDTGSTLECTESTNSFKVVIGYEDNKLVSTQVEQLGDVGIDYLSDSIQIDLSNINEKFTIFGNMLFFYEFKETPVNIQDQFKLSIHSIIMPDSIIEIEDGSYIGVGALINAGNIVVTSGCFANLRYCNNITISSKLEKVGTCSFASCSADSTDNEAKELYLPSSINEIGEFAFLDTIFLFSNFENTKITELKYGCFDICVSITNLVVPDTVTKIGDMVFGCCVSLKSITIPKNCKSIGGGAFALCISLEEIVIPTSVNEIGTGCFFWCESLERIIFNKSSNSSLVSINNECVSFNQYVEWLLGPSGPGSEKFTNINQTFYTKNPTGTRILFNDDTTRDKYQGFVSQSQNNWGVDNTGISAQNQITIETNPNPLTPDAPINPSENEPSSIRVLDQSGKEIINNTTFKIDSTSGSIQFSAQVLDVNGSTNQVDQSVKWSLTSDNENITCQNSTISWKDLASGKVYSFNLKVSSIANASVETSINNIKLSFNVNSQTLWEQYMWLWIALMVAIFMIITIATIVVIVKKRKVGIYNKDKDLEKLLK